jgi:type II secretory pathway component PulC
MEITEQPVQQEQTEQTEQSVHKAQQEQSEQPVQEDLPEQTEQPVHKEQLVVIQYIRLAKVMEAALCFLCMMVDNTA